MGVEAATSYLVAAGLRHHGAPEAGQQRACQHDAAAQRTGQRTVVGAVEHVELHLVGAELEGASAFGGGAHVLPHADAEHL